MSLPTGALRAHLGPTGLFALTALVTLWRLILLGNLPFDAAWQDRFRPWHHASQPAAMVSPNLLALREGDRSELEPFRRYWGSYLAGDQVATGWPDWLEVRRQVRAGHLPLWRPRVFTGTPLSIGNAASPWSPLTWAGFVLPLVRGRGVVLWSHLTLAALAFYALLLRRGRSRRAATVGALAYAYNPVFMVWLAFGDTVPIFAALPLALLALHEIRDSPDSRRAAAVFAAATSLELLSGNPQFAAYAVAIQSTYALVLLLPSSRRLSLLGWVGAASAVGALGAAIHLVPFAELAGMAARPPNRYAASNFLPPGSLLALLFPRVFGHPAHGDFVGGYLFFRSFFSLSGPGLSSLAVALAVVGALAPANRRLAAVCVAVPAFLAALSLSPLHHLVVAALPFFDSLEAPRMLVAFYFVLALLVAEGVDALDAPRAPRAMFVTSAVLVALAVALDAYARLGAPSAFARHLRFLSHPIFLLSPRVLIPVALTAGVGFFARYARSGTLLATWGLPLAVAAELAVLSVPTVPASPAARVLRETPGIHTLRAMTRARDDARFIGLTEADTFPFYDGDHLPPNTPEAFGLNDLRGCARLRPSPIVELLAATQGRSSPTIATADNVDLPLFDLLDVGFVLSAHPLNPAHFDRAAPGIWRNRRDVSRAFFTRCAVTEASAQARLRRLVSPDFNPRAAAILESSVPVSNACEVDPRPFALTVRYPDETHAVLSVDAPVEGFVVLADAWFPGWEVTVDGVPQSVLRVDHALRGAVVSAGHHRVEFAYKPASVADGAALSLFAWTLIALAFFVRKPRLDPALGAGAIASVALLAYSWRGAFPNDNDALYGGVIRSMREQGHWILLQLDGVPFLDKPPLFFWVGALVTSALGESEFTLRLPALVSGIACVVVTARLARRLSGSDAAAWVAGLVLLTAPQFYEYSRRAYMEVPVTLAVLCSFDYALRSRWRAAGAWAGVGFMLKSVVGLLGFAPVVLAELVRTRKISRELALSALLAGLIVAPWHVAVLALDARTLLDFTVNLHVRDQMLSAQPWSTGGPFFYLASTLKQDPLIAVSLLLGSVFGVREWLRSRDRELGTLLLAVALQAVLYSAISTKKTFYVLTAYPLIAVLGARAVAPWLDAEARRRALAFALVAAAFVAQDLSLLSPDPRLQPGTYLAPLGAYVARNSPANTRLYTLDTYLAAPQFYARRPAFYAVTSAEVVRLIGRIPYLRYGHKTLVWDDALLAQGAWVIATTRDALAMVARVPNARIVARTDAYALVRGMPDDPAPRAAVEAVRARFRQTFAARHTTPAQTYAALVDALPAWSETLVAAGVPLPRVISADPMASGDARLVVVRVRDAAEARAWMRPERAVIAVESSETALPGALTARVGATMVPLAGQHAHALALAPGEQPWMTADNGAVLGAVSVTDGAVLVRLGVNLAGLFYRLRQGDPALRDRDSDGNGELQPADLIPRYDHALDATPFADLTVDALFDSVNAALACPLARTRGLPAGVSSLVVLTSDQDFASERRVRQVAEILREHHATATFLLTDRRAGSPPDLNARDADTAVLGEDLARELLAAGHGLGVHPFPRSSADLANHIGLFTESYRMAPFAARDHHLRWSGFAEIPRAESAAGVVVNFDYMVVCSPGAPCAGFLGGSARPMAFLDGSTLLPIVLQPTSVDDFSLRVDRVEALPDAARLLAERALRQLSLARSVGVPLVVNAHPTFLGLAPQWLRPVLSAPDTRTVSAEQWIDFVARRRASVIAFSRCADRPAVTLDPAVTLR